MSTLSRSECYLSVHLNSSATRYNTSLSCSFVPLDILSLQQPAIAAHCNNLPLQHTATTCHCNTLQHIATHCNTLQHIATHHTVCPHFLSVFGVRTDTFLEFSGCGTSGNQRVWTPTPSWWYKSKMHFSSELMVQINPKRGISVGNPLPGNF